MRDYTEEELKMLSDVLPNIALQLRTSLSTIYTAVDRMAPQETREKDPKTDRTAAAFYQSYYQLYRVISNLTDAGNLFERKRFELYDDDIVGVCRSVCAEVDFLFAQRGVELDFLADRKLLLNLLSNALKFTPKGGSVRVRVKTEGRFVKITVADTGKGMDSDTLTHLFDRFMDGGQDPMPPHGLGLGLPICQRIAQGHGGMIVAQSEEGKGSLFTVSLPAVKAGRVQLKDRGSDYAGGFNGAMANAYAVNNTPAASTARSWRCPTRFRARHFCKSIWIKGHR